MSERPVVLGIKDRQHPEVLSFAMAEAARRGVPLRVVRAVAEQPGPGHRVTGGSHPSQDGTVRIDESVVVGPVVDVLLEESTTCSVLVLGADDAPWVSRARGVEISRAVASRAHAPVVIVPRTAVGARRTSGVVVAVDGSKAVEGQLAYAFEAARDRGESLMVIYVPGATCDYPTRQHHLYHLEDAVDRWRARFPDVVARTVVEPGHPVQTCVIASADASLLVVGQPTGEHPRLVARAVAAGLLRRSSAPVAVVPLEPDRSVQSA
jgi:nucleotide-binding universal stress UspA family protein